LSGKATCRRAGYVHGGGRGDAGDGGRLDLARGAERTARSASEELLASTRASSCYAMALVHTPAEEGVLIEGLTFEAAATLDDERLRISALDLDVRGSVAVLSEEQFGRLAQEAEKACPVSDAIRTNVEVRLRANLLED